MGWAYHLGAWQRDKQKTELVKVDLAFVGGNGRGSGRGGGYGARHMTTSKERLGSVLGFLCTACNCCCILWL